MQYYIVYTYIHMHLSFILFSLKVILLRCELNFTDIAAVFVTAVSSVFSAAKAVKTAVIAAKADATAIKTTTTAANTVMTLNFQTYVTIVFERVPFALYRCRSVGLSFLIS